MGLPQLNSCCTIFDLKTGCIIMGSINAFLSFVMMSVMIVVASAMGSLDISQDFPDDPDQQAALTGLYVMYIILSIMFCCKFLFDVLFVWGVSTERRGIIKAYMIMWIVFCLLSMFIFFLKSPSFSAGTIITELIYLGHNVYTILLSHSFYTQLNTREEV